MMQKSMRTIYLPHKDQPGVVRKDRINYHHYEKERVGHIWSLEEDELVEIGVQNTHSTRDMEHSASLDETSAH